MMVHTGRKPIIWTKEMDDKILTLSGEGKHLTSIANATKTSVQSVNDRLRAMGFDGLKDARNVMRG